MRGSMGGRGRGAWCAGLALVLAAAACGTDDGERAAVPGDTAIQPGMAPDGDTLVGAAPAPAAAGERAISSNLTEWEVRLSPATVPAGEVTFQVANTGTMHHALEVEGEGIEEETEHLQPGQNATLTVNLPPGTYEVYCPVDDETGNHRAQGMTTRLVVQ